MPARMAFQARPKMVEGEDKIASGSLREHPGGGLRAHRARPIQRIACLTVGIGSVLWWRAADLARQTIRPYTDLLLR